MFEELGELKYKGRIAFYIYNEPLRDKRILSILMLAREMVPKSILMISTNADYMKENTLDNLFAAGLNMIRINVYSANDGDRNTSKVREGVEKAKKRATVIQGWMDCRPDIDQTKSVDSGGSCKSKRATLHHKYGVKQDGANFGGGFELQNRSGNVEWLAASTIKTYTGVCTRPFRIMQVNWRGDAILCCNDYHGSTTWGNVRQNSLVELWNHVALHQARLELQDGVRTGLCKHCDFRGGAYRHMIHRVANVS